MVSTSASGSSHRAVQDSARNLSGIEVIFCELPRRAAMMLVVGVNGFERAGRLLGRRKSKHPLAIGKKRARPRVLHDHGFAAGQVADRAITHPGILKLSARSLGATELTARLLNVGLIHLRSGGHFARVPDTPTAAFQVFPV